MSLLSGKNGAIGLAEPEATHDRAPAHEAHAGAAAWDAGLPCGGVLGVQLHAGSGLHAPATVRAMFSEYACASPCPRFHPGKIDENGMVACAVCDHWFLDDDPTVQEYNGDD